MSASKKSKGTLIAIATPVVIILVILANSLFLNLTVRLVPENPDKIIISNPYLEQSAEITDPAGIKEVVDEINSSTIVCLSVFGLPTHPESGNDRRMTFTYGDSELTCRFDGNHFEANVRGKKKIFFLLGTPLDGLVGRLDSAG